MTSERIATHDRPVPRYTSYPTAPHFHDAIGPDDYAAWLTALEPSRRLSLYLHVPFCDQLCWYCGCHTKITARYAPIAACRDGLLAEIDLVAAKLPGRMRVDHVHWGGGTPTLLAPKDFLALMDRLRHRFDIAATAEIAVEIDPRGLGDVMVEALAEAGVTRASLGVQDFDPKVQRAINRWQPQEVTASAVDRLRAAGIEQINFDLMYGLPLQTLDGVIASVDRAVALRPQRLALFGYAHVPWMKRHQRLIDESRLPDAELRWAQAAAAASRLQEHGYVWIGLDHFAGPADELARAAGTGRLRRNFQGYTTDGADALIGLGASAIGALPQGYVQNAAEIKAWRSEVLDGRLATRRGIRLTTDDRLARDAIERLMCDLAVDLGAVARRYGRKAARVAVDWDALERLEADGVIGIDGERIALTPRGRPLMRVVAAAFDRYLASGIGRHSKAI